MYRKALITSLTLAAAAGAISCTAATAVETPTQSGSITISDNGQPNRDQTRSLTVVLITKNGAGNAATTPELVTASPAEAETPAEEPVQEAPAEAPTDAAPQEGSTPEAETPAEAEAPATETDHSEPREETPAPSEAASGEVEVVIAPSTEPTHEVPETPGNTDVPINPSPEPTTPAPETPGNTDVPIAPEPEPARSEHDETPADHQPADDTAPVIEPEPEPSTPAPEATETPGEVEVVIAPTPEPSQKAPADTAGNEAPDNSEVVSTEVPIAPEDAQAHSRATSDTGDHAVTGSDEVGIAPQAPGAKTPKKGSETKPAADAKSPTSVPSAQSTAPATARDELAYTGISAETGGIAVGGFMLILTGAAGVWSVRRKASNA